MTPTLFMSIYPCIVAVVTVLYSTGVVGFTPTTLGAWMSIVQC